MASKLFGDWKSLKVMSNNLDKDLIKESKAYLKKEADEIKKEVQQTIYSQSGGWQPLKDTTVKEKGSDTILIETGQLVDSIQVEKISDLEYAITPQGNHSSGLSNSELATIHEYGTEKIPPRPFIRPTYDKEVPEVPKEMGAVVKSVINKY